MTYLGGNNNDYGKGIFVDPAGNAYITGQTNSGNPSRGRETRPRRAYDAFAAKISTDGAVVWSTYLGGNKEDAGLGITADSAGNAYISGDTYSSNSAGANNTFKGWIVRRLRQISPTDDPARQLTSVETRKNTLAEFPSMPRHCLCGLPNQLHRF